MIPRSVLIGQRRYKIRGRPPGEVSGVDGVCYFDLKFIYINPECEEKRETLLHEIIHAVFHEYKINPRKDRQPYFEGTVSALETGLMQVFRDNPKVVKYIVQEGT